MQEVSAMTITDEQGPEALLPLTPAVFHILLALSDGERHGYAIMKTVEAQTDGQVTMGPGTLYGSIKRMLAANLIAESDERPDPDMDDSRRRYYRLSDFGARVMAAEAARLAKAVQIARQKAVLPPAPVQEMG
jgi:DNA-binding PadR family transcriptional regulator